MAGKLWRSRGRFLLSNAILFGLGVMTCLICLQMFAADGINDPIVYTNPDEYRLALQASQSATDQDHNSNGIKRNTNIAAATDPQLLHSVLCGPNSAAVSVNKAANPKDNDNIVNTDHFNNNNDITLDHNERNNDIFPSSQKLSSSGSGKSDSNALKFQQDELKHFEGVTLPTDNNNLNLSPNDIFNNKDLLLQEENSDGSPGPTVWMVTPTFYRPEQKPELTRVAQALLPVSDFVHWIVIEDTSKGTQTSFEDLKSFLQRFPLAVTVLKSLPPKSKIVGKPRGVGGRTAAIQWLRENANEGVVYFGDDDNTYDSSIFKQVSFGFLKEILGFTCKISLQSNIYAFMFKTYLSWCKL